MNNNERVISDPEVAGWELDPDTGYWMWKGEEGTGGGLWEANGDDIYYSLGNVGVGTNDPSTKFDVSFSSDNTSSANHADDNAGIKSTNTGSGRNLLKLMGVGGSGIAWGQNGTDTSFTFTDRNSSDSGPRLTIDSAGDATFSGTVTSSSLKTDCAKFANNQDHAYLVAGTAGWTGATDNWNTYGFQHRIKTNANGKPRVTIDTALGEKFSVDNDGSATFSGTVNASEFITSQAVVDRGIYRPNANGCGIRLSNTNAIFPSDSTGTQSNGVVDLGGTGYQFKDGWFTGTVTSTRMTQGGSPVIDAKGLIETLSTLRKATMDETKDIRESLRSAIDELVAGFEQEIATMPAPEPETGTMEE